MLFQGGSGFSNFVSDVFAVFLFVVWFWLLMTVAGDLIPSQRRIRPCQNTLDNSAHRAALCGHLCLLAHAGARHG